VFRKRKSINDYKALLASQHVPTLSEVITIAESKKPEDQILFQNLLNEILPLTGSSLRLGISGPPGVGKSSFIEAFGPYILQYYSKLAILAIDPSSQKTKGSILGDKTRMEKLSQNPRVFIRPTAAGNTLGGVAQHTREAILLCEAAGFDFIIIESVGVGQSEVELQQMTDFFLLLQLPGSGDELQGIKRGIMELADCIAITKSEGENRKLALKAAQELRFALHLLSPINERKWEPQVYLTSSKSGEGLAEIMEVLLNFHKNAKQNGWLQKKREQQQINWFHKLFQTSLVDFFYQHQEINQQIVEAEKAIFNRQITPSIAAYRILEQIFSKFKA
jgi:LAO/AO transport system kinase